MSSGRDERITEAKTPDLPERVNQSLRPVRKLATQLKRRRAITAPRFTPTSLSVRRGCTWPRIASALREGPRRNVARSLDDGPRPGAHDSICRHGKIARGLSAKMRYRAPSSLRRVRNSCGRLKRKARRRAMRLRRRMSAGEDVVAWQRRSRTSLVHTKYVGRARH